VSGKRDLREEVEREAEILKRVLKEDIRKMRREWSELFWELVAMGSPLALEVLEEGEEG
jgi:hypothetical protein